MKQPNEIEVGNLIIERLDEDEFFLKPRNRATRIITEILMREMYFKGFNKNIEKQLPAWISVDTPPKPKERVLCFPRQYPFGMMREADYEEYTNQNLDWFKEVFSHWMPLPSKPILTTED